MKYYTYAYLRKDGTPYYIGKGTGNRAYLQLNHMVKTPERERVLILKQNLTEEEANRHEIYMVGVLGRKDIGTGILRNLTDGGEGVSGYRHTEETKQLMRSYVKTEEHRDRLRENARHRWENNIGKWTPPPKQKGKKYWTDGKTNKMSFHCPGEGWRLGRISNSKPPSQKGMKWWNNRQINKKSVECPGDGWRRGML